MYIICLASRVLLLTVRRCKCFGNVTVFLCASSCMRLEGSWCFHLQGLDYLNVKMKAPRPPQQRPASHLQNTCQHTTMPTQLSLTTWLPPSDRPLLGPTIAARNPRGRSVQGPARRGTLARRKRGCPCPPPDGMGTTQHRWSSEPWRSSTLSLRAWCGPSPACGSCPRSRTRGGLQVEASKMLQAVGFTRSREISVSLPGTSLNVLVRYC